MEPAPQTQAAKIIRWNPDVFRSTEWEKPGSPEIFDLTGRQRFLFFGPYHELEPGLWRARVELELSDDAGKRILTLQFGIDPDFTSIDLPRGVEGPLPIVADYAVKGPGPIQIRLWLRWGALHGTVRFTGVTLERLGDIAATPGRETPGASDTGSSGRSEG